MYKLLCVPMACFLLAVVCAAQSSMTDEEKVLEQLERESLTHNSPIDADIEWWKPHVADRGVLIDPLGHVYSFTPSE
jgi:hypothetical protein